MSSKPWKNLGELFQALEKQHLPFSNPWKNKPSYFPTIGKAAAR